MTTQNNEAPRTEAELKAELERLKRENAVLKQDSTKIGELSFKVTDKGGVSIYGVGRFPVTLYPEQWRKILPQHKEILAFIDENEAKGMFPNAEQKEKNKAATKENTKKVLAELNKDKAA